MQERKDTREGREMVGKETTMRNIFKEQEKDVSEHKRKYEETQKREMEQN